MPKKQPVRLIQTRIPTLTFRRLTQAAAKEGISVAAYVRRELMQRFDTEYPGERDAAGEPHAR